MSSTRKKKASAKTVATPWVVKSQADVARAFDVSIKTVESWRRDAMPGTKGAYDLIEISAWKTRKEVARSATRVSRDEVEDEDDPDGPSAKYWETRFRKARAELSELKLQAERGEMVPRDEIIQAWAARFSQAKASILTIGQSSTKDPLVARRIDRTARQVLETLAAPGLPGVPDEVNELLSGWLSEGDDESAA